MPPARNQPCPCGSGRKYKHCCLSEAPLRLPSAPGGAPDTDAPWQVDLVPLPIALGDDRDARPAVLLVVRDGEILHHDILAHPPAEPAAVAALLAEAIGAVAGREGLPREVSVRHTSVADALAEAGLLSGVRIASGRLDSLDTAASSLIGFLNGTPPAPPGRPSMTATWRAWGLPVPLVAELFRAAARFYRARPWRLLYNEDVLEFRAPPGPALTLCVLGAAAEEFGLVLYRDRSDARRMRDAASPATAFAGFRDTVISLTLDRRDELPPRMRKEILAAGWEVAAPDAYPVLMVFNTPGGGVTAAQAGALTAALNSVAGFADQFRDRLSAGARGVLTWEDPAAGTTITSKRRAPREQLEAPEVLSKSLPEGPGADPAAAITAPEPADLERRSRALLRRFESTLIQARYSEAIRRRDLGNAELLLAGLAAADGIPFEAMTEYDLCYFLWDWCIRNVDMTKAELRSIPVSLKRFFAYVAGHEGIRFPWAEAILAERSWFEVRLQTFPGGFFWNEVMQEWQNELMQELTDLELLPVQAMAGGGTWGTTMGLTEYRLHRELRRRWLLWRDEVIDSGIGDPGDVRKELIRRQRAWEAEPHSSFGGATPVAVVKQERARHPGPTPGSPARR